MKMKKQICIGLLIAVIAAMAAVLFVQGSLLNPPNTKTGFTVVALNDNSTLLSDSDVVSFNSTSQEITLTDSAAQRLQAAGNNLYNYSNTISIRVNGEEIYTGIFRSAIMSAVPEPPTVAILYPSITFPDGHENDNALRLFYPNFTPPSSMQVMNTKLVDFFQETNRHIA